MPRQMLKSYFVGRQGGRVDSLTLSILRKLMRHVVQALGPHHCSLGLRRFGGGRFKLGR